MNIDLFAGKYLDRRLTDSSSWVEDGLVAEFAGRLLERRSAG